MKKRWRGQRSWCRGLCEGNHRNTCLLHFLKKPESIWKLLVSLWLFLAFHEGCPPELSQPLPKADVCLSVCVLPVSLSVCQTGIMSHSWQKCGWLQSAQWPQAKCWSDYQRLWYITYYNPFGVKHKEAYTYLTCIILCDHNWKTRFLQFQHLSLDKPILAFIDKSLSRLWKVTIKTTVWMFSF